jgi:hypothetical protein
VRRGRRRTVQRIDRASVFSVRSRRSWGSQAIQLFIRGPSVPLAARFVRGLMRRDRVVLRDDVFDREAFADLARRLATWKG